MSHNQLDRTVDATTGIPAVTFFLVLKGHLKKIGRTTKVRKGRHVYDEGIVAVCPMTYLATVHIDVWIGHRAVKHQLGTVIVTRHGKCRLVIPFANPWQGTRTPRLLGGYVLTVLLDGDYLKVPFLVKGAANGPVMGHSYRLPIDLVARELPTLTKNDLTVTLCHCGYCHQGRQQDDNLSHCCFSCWLMASM